MLSLTERIYFRWVNDYRSLREFDDREWNASFQCTGLSQVDVGGQNAVNMCDLRSVFIPCYLESLKLLVK